ncbi:hypothetical protein TWF481_009296 [Arthrobotrys musiformis]|uniref:Uncharacterized protein n=1 Tax=Arthrobotrys musiformis TaxID=47236 RepID=A0AAV9W4G6_9PEZI
MPVLGGQIQLTHTGSPPRTGTRYGHFILILWLLLAPRSLAQRIPAVEYRGDSTTSSHPIIVNTGTHVTPSTLSTVTSSSLLAAQTVLNTTASTLNQTDTNPVKDPSNANTSTQTPPEIVPPPFAEDDGKRAVSPSIFFSMRIVCSSTREIVEDPRTPDQFPQFRLRRQVWSSMASRPDYHRLLAEGRAPKVVRAGVVRYLGMWCHTCRCDEATGELVASAEGERCGPRDEQYKLCRSWYNCHCEAEVLNPELDGSETLEAHIDALNRLPQWFRERNPDYEWAPPTHAPATWRPGQGLGPFGHAGAPAALAQLGQIAGPNILEGPPRHEQLYGPEPDQEAIDNILDIGAANSLLDFHYYGGRGAGGSGGFGLRKKREISSGPTSLSLRESEDTGLGEIDGDGE